MGYIFDKEVLFILGIPVYIIILGVLIFLRKKKGIKITLSKELVKFLFGLYIFGLVGVTLFPLEIYFRGQSLHTFAPVINYIPFASIARDVAEVGHGHFSTAFQIKLLIRNVGGNFALLMPLGMIVPILWKRINSFVKATLLGFGISLSIELLQLIEGYLKIGFLRIVDVDDLILNTLGAAVGYIIYAVINKAIFKYKNRTRVEII